MDNVATKPVRPPPPSIRRSALSVFTELARRTKFADPALASQWKTIVGAELAALCRPGRLPGGRGGRRLEIVVPSGSAASRVSMEAESIRQKVNQVLGPGAVSGVSIVQTGRTPSPEGPDNDAPGPVGAALRRFRASVNARGRDR